MASTKRHDYNLYQISGTEPVPEADMAKIIQNALHIFAHSLSISAGSPGILYICPSLSTVISAFNIFW